MEIIEQNLVAKNPKGKSEDGIVVTSDFVAVIDGSTSKSRHRLSRQRPLRALLDGAWNCSNGRYAMMLASRYIRRMSKDSSCEQFLRGVTAAIHKHYKEDMLPRLEEHPEDRLTCSAIVFSRLRREIWMVGDCQGLIMPHSTFQETPHVQEEDTPHATLLENPKPAEAELAAMRAEGVKRLLTSGVTQDELLRNDLARPVIIPRMLQTMQQQNISYSVIDGFPIPRQHVRIIPLDFQPWEVVLASDGYPFLCATLSESEQALHRQRINDPLNIGPDFQATKAFHPDFNSFDDRAYIRFKV